MMMKCGCSSNGRVLISRDGKRLDPPIPICHTHNCTDPMPTSPDLTGRMARCVYCGKPKPNRRYANDECNYGCNGKPFCECKAIPSSENLPFFEYKPNMPLDKFYCGCFGWD